MNFAHLPLGWVLAGLAGLAGALFLLQRLRVRHREQTVITTLFWKEALEEARARVLVDRFRHPWAYLFILAILSLMWLALAGPRATASDEREYVLLLDGSAGMAWGDRFEQTVLELETAVESLPRDRTQVLLCEATTSCLLQAGEASPLLAQRLADFRPRACPSSLEETIVQLAESTPAERERSVWIFGDGPISEHHWNRFASTLALKRVGESAERPPNLSIRSVGVSQARSGSWNRCDVLVRVAGDGELATCRLEVELDGQPWTTPADHEQLADESRWLLSDLPALGGQLVLRITGGGSISIDDEAQLALPDRPLIRVAAAADLAPRLRAVLAADPAIRFDDTDADLRIRNESSDGAADSLPVLEFVSAASQPQAFLIQHEEALDSVDLLDELVADLGLEQIDATELATQMQRRIEVGAVAGPERSVRVWRELLDESYNFTGARAFPVFVARAIRWLARSESSPARVAAGEAVFERSLPHTQSEGDRTLDPGGLAFVPPYAGSYRDLEGRPLTASLLAPELALGTRREEVDRGGADEATSSGFDPWVLLAGLAFLLLIIEWFLHRSGRIP